MWLYLMFPVFQLIFPFLCQVVCHLIRQYSRLCVSAYEYFILLGRVTNLSAKPKFLEDQFLSLSLASLLRPLQLGRPHQEHKAPTGIARKVIVARKPPPPPTHNDKRYQSSEQWLQDIRQDNYTTF
jgi:hypothetical protein